MERSPHSATNTSDAVPMNARQGVSCVVRRPEASALLIWSSAPANSSSWELTAAGAVFHASCNQQMGRTVAHDWLLQQVSAGPPR